MTGVNMKNKRIIITLIFALIALAGIIQGAIMLLPSHETKPVQAATVKTEDRIGGAESRFTSSATFDIPDFYAPFPLELRLRVVEYQMVLINLKATYVPVTTVTVSAPFDVGTNAVLYNGISPGGTVTATRISGNKLSVSYNRNDGAYSVQISDIWVTSYTIPDLQQDEVLVKFVSQSENTFSYVILNKGASLTSSQIPAYTDYIPSLYQHIGWQTKNGVWAHEAVITANTEFYPVMERNFEYGDRRNEGQIEIAYEKGKYTNSTLTRDFSSGAFQFPADQSIQAMQDPLLLNCFYMDSLEIPWGKYETYFTLTLDVPRTNNFIPSSTNRKNLVLKSDSNYVYLLYGSQELKKWNFNDFIRQPQNKESWKQNCITFTLEVQSGVTEPSGYKPQFIEWQLQYGTDDNTITDSGALPDGVYRYDFNDGVGFLGLVGVNINRNSSYTYTWETGGFLGIGTKTHKHTAPKEFPTLQIKGFECRIKKVVQCYIEGKSPFTANLAVNHFEEVVIPAGISNPDNTIRWYLNSAYTLELQPNFHTARNYNELYGKWVPAEYNVTLVYYTVDRYKATINGGKYYDALVKKSFTKTKVRKGAVINLNDFGSDSYDVNFYNNIQGIPFLRWDMDIKAPVTESITITGIYRFPTATLRYFDVDDKLYGTVKQDMTMYPVDKLLDAVKQADDEHKEWWLYEKPEDKGFLGKAYGFFESIARSIFGSDNVINGANNATREAQRKDSRYIIEQLAREHSTRNAYGEHRLYFLPVVFLDINLEQLNKGAYGNEAFNVREEDNPQWHLISGTPKLNNLVYYADVHNVYSLDSSTFNMAINFEKKMDGFDAMAKTTANFFGWVGNFFGDIFGSFFGGLFKGGLGWLYTLITFAVLFIIAWFFIRPLLIGFCIWLANLLIELLNKIGGTT